MKYQILPVMAASVCLLTVLVSGTAYAQQSPLDIALDFCGDVEEAANETGNELGEAAADLADCSDEYNQCLGGIFENQPVSCISDFIQCTDNAHQDAAQACNVFEKRMVDAFEDALRRARWTSQPDEHDVQSLLATTLRQQCFAPAVVVADLCSERLTSGGSP